MARNANQYPLGYIKAIEFYPHRPWNWARRGDIFNRWGRSRCLIYIQRCQKKAENKDYDSWPRELSLAIQRELFWSPTDPYSTSEIKKKKKKKNKCREVIGHMTQ